MAFSERRALCNIVLHRCQHCRTKHLPGAVDLVRVAGVVVEEVGERGAAVRAAEARGVPRPRPRPRPLRRDRGVASHQRPPAAPTRTNWPLLCQRNFAVLFTICVFSEYCVLRNFVATFTLPPGRPRASDMKANLTLLSTDTGAGPGGGVGNTASEWQFRVLQ